MTDKGTDREKHCSWATVLITTILTTAGNGVWLFYQFKNNVDCAGNIAILIVTTVFIVFFYVAACLKLCNVHIFRENATPLTCSVASVYILYMSWTATSSNPVCHPLDPALNSALQIIVGVIFTYITIFSIAVASNEQDERN